MSPVSLDLSAASRFILQLLGLPEIYKYAFLILLLLNVRSFPLAWHVRVFRPMLQLRFRHLVVSLRLRLFKSRTAREDEMEEWLETLPLVGANPLQSVVTYRSWASIDESDFNGHLSNSSYAKSLDCARQKACGVYVPSFYWAGGWMALGATNYHFIREIPMFSKYEIRISILSWDNKWMFIVARFVTQTKGKNSKLTGTNSYTPSPPDTFKIPSSTEPLDGTSTLLTVSPRESSDTLNPMKAFTAAQISQEEPDNATLHCLAVSQVCFKHGRITVPPAVVLACEGFSTPPTSTSESYSHANPPPHLAHVRAIRLKRAGGSMDKMHTLLKGGWRDVPEGKRWWEDALGGEVEKKRKENLEVLDGLRTGMMGARGMYPD